MSNQTTPPRTRARGAAGLARAKVWLAAGTWWPEWTPPRMRRPSLSYLAGALVAVAAVLATRGLEHAVTEYGYHGALSFLAVLWVALAWGPAPATLAALLDAALLGYVLVPPGRTTLTAQNLGFALSLLVAVTVAVVAGTAQARRRQLASQQVALRESEAHFRRLVETAGEGIMVIDAQHLMTLVNQRLATMLGYDAEELLGRSVATFMHDGSGSAVLTAIERCQAGIVAPVEGRLLTKDGDEVWATIAATPILDRGGASVGTLAMVSDLTARRQMEAALERANRELVRSNAELSLFAAAAAHDLRAPL